MFFQVFHHVCMVTTSSCRWLPVLGATFKKNTLMLKNIKQHSLLLKIILYLFFSNTTLLIGRHFSLEYASFLQSYFFLRKSPKDIVMFCTCTFSHILKILWPYSLQASKQNMKWLSLSMQTSHPVAQVLCTFTFINVCGATEFDGCTTESKVVQEHFQMQPGSKKSVAGLFPERRKCLFSLCRCLCLGVFDVWFITGLFLSFMTWIKMQ